MIQRVLSALAVAFYFLISTAGLSNAQSAGLSLVMMEEHGCRWCATWNQEIGPIYPKTPEGQAAPLQRLDIHDPLPDHLTLTRPAFYTPTFILMQDGTELARIEGYPGEDFFWGLLGMMLKEHTDFAGAS